MKSGVESNGQCTEEHLGQFFVTAIIIGLRVQCGPGQFERRLKRKAKKLRQGRVEENDTYDTN
ncbi:hypothetical protein BD289DRAFT_395307 [Coniella lustricola]|uniref:Uncharacterized protein n=1 Tax=Coniella lustricola TaxID=2025994 RepID=A0A2T2ZZ97_9PEZI|nr:hypothetical protein BD289DRAFT_395307 [Coniella lustricola]